MTSIVQAALAALVITSLWMLGSARLRSCVAAITVQGVILGVLPLILGSDAPAWRLALQAGLSLSLKGAIFPLLLMRAIRSTRASTEAEPAVGYSASLLIGVVLIAASLWIGSRLPETAAGRPKLLVPVTLFTAFTGLFLVVTRASAIVQVLGYLALENGISAFGMALAEQEPLLVEMGTFLDAFAAVFVMGITVFRIGRQFDHLDADRLSDLKDWPS